MSHSFFGVSVKVASPAPVASSASLYATLPVSCTRMRPLNASHSPRWSSERLASTSASGRRAVHRRALTAGGGVEAVRGRVVLDRDHRPAILHQRDAYAELRDVLEELLRAVERVDHPDAALAEPLGRIGGLLGEPAVSGEGGGDQRADARVGLQVGPGDGVVRPLLRHADAAFVVAADDRPGRARGALGQLALAREGRHRRGFKPPSGPKSCAAWYSRTSSAMSASRRS